MAISADKETEAWRDKAIGPKSHSQEVEEPRFISQRSGSKGIVMCTRTWAGSAHWPPCH